MDPHWAARIAAQQPANPIVSPDFAKWRRWGATETFTVPWSGAALETFEQTVPQIVDARFDRPLAWMLAFNSIQAAADGSILADKVTFTALIRYGLGSGAFIQEIPVGVFPLGRSIPEITTFGPVPAETVVIGVRVNAEPNLAGPFPRVASYTFGAFCAPQVW